MSSHIVVIGTTAFLPGFALAGVRHTILADTNTFLARIEEHRDAGIIILEEELLDGRDSQVREKLELSLSPVIVLLGKDPHRQTQRMKKTIMNTLGVDLLT